MLSKFKASDKEDQAADDSNCGSSEPESDKPRIRWGDMSSTNHTTNEPSSASATEVSSGATTHPTCQEGLPTLAAASTAAAPPVPPVKKKSRRAGFREQFLQQLRVMLDRESQDGSTTVHWSTDGHSFIIMDQTRFEEHIIPTYFGNPIMFSSFLSKLSRWGFRRIPSSRIDCYEFRLPTFRRLGAGSAPTAAAAAAADTSSNAGAGDSIQVPQQVLPLFQQVMAQMQQDDAQTSLSHAIADLVSTIQRQRSSQQPTMTNQQPAMNQNVVENSYLRSLQQSQHPNPITNTLNTALSNMIGRQASPAPLVGYFSPSFHNFVIQSLMILSGTVPNTSTAARSESNNIAALDSLVMAMQQVVEEELQRQNRVDDIQNAIFSIIGQMCSGQGGLPDDDILQSQHIQPARGEPAGSEEHADANIGLGNDDNGDDEDSRKRDSTDNDDQCYEDDADSRTKSLRPRKSPRK